MKPTQQEINNMSDDEFVFGFIKATENWLRKSKGVSEHTCPFCGIRPTTMKRLIKIIKTRLVKKKDITT